MKKQIWGNVIVKNEGRFIYFALMSVINYLDKMLIWDTGSTDHTVEIIKYLQKKYPQKISFEEIGEVDANGLTQARQKMLEQTTSDWLLIVDGDEVWWENSIKKTIAKINQDGEKINAIVNPVINVVGDIYHYQHQSVGEYQILGRKGHFNIRAINRRIPKLHIKNEYPLEGFYDQHNQLIQNSGSDKLAFLDDAPIFHLTHLERSSIKQGDSQAVKRKGKIKYELGHSFGKNFKYPETFYLEHPDFVPSPWTKMSNKFYFRALVETPLKKIKRRLVKSV